MKNKAFTMVLAIAMVLNLCACSAENATAAGEKSVSQSNIVSETERSSSMISQSEDEDESSVPASVQRDDEDAKESSLEDNATDEEFVAAVNRFALHSAAQLLEKEGGCYSPLSMYYALALVAEGAQGQTAEELCTLLGVDKEQLGKPCLNLYQNLFSDDDDDQIVDRNKNNKPKPHSAGVDEKGTLLMANSLWMDDEVQGMPVQFRDEYLQKAAECYGAEAFTVDFSDKSTGQQIGDWVYETTQKKLRIEPEPDNSQIMSIINTVFFSSMWCDPFDDQSTEEDVFTLSDGTKLNKQYMHETETGDCYQGAFL